MQLILLETDGKTLILHLKKCLNFEKRISLYCCCVLNRDTLINLFITNRMISSVALVIGFNSFNIE